MTDSRDDLKIPAEYDDPRCIVCGARMPDWKPEFCCDGFHSAYANGCGCHGEPINQCICDECEDEPLTPYNDPHAFGGLPD